MTDLSFTSDRPNNNDALGRTDFARSLAYALLSASGRDGLVIGIEGDWGAGKSTILGFVKKQIIETTEIGATPVLVEFNPWLISTTGALVEALISQIASALSLSTDNAQRGIAAGEKLIGYVGLLKHLKHLKYFKYAPGLGWIGNLAGDGAELIDAVTSSADTTDEALKEIKSALPKLDINARKNEVIDALIDFNRPIIVFVDDLDRLPAEEIKTLVQTIKAVADFPRTIYVLAYDRQVVTNALGNGDGTKGLAYLEKIVQVAYPIPPLFQFQMTQFVENTLGELLSTLGVYVRDFERARYPDAIRIAATLMRQPRDVVRLANRLILSVPATKGEVNICDVLVFEAISLRFPSIRERVHRHPSDYVGTPFDVDSIAYTDTDWFNWARERHSSPNDEPSWVKGLPSNDSEYQKIKKALGFIFGRDERNTVAPEDHLRMLASNRLARYFTMTSLDSVPEVAAIHSLLKNPQLLEQALSVDTTQELESTLEWIHTYVPSCSEIQSPGSSITLASAAKKAEGKSDWNASLARLFSKVIARVLRHSDLGTRGTALLQLIELAPLSVSVSVLLDAVAEQGKWIVGPAKQRPFEEQLVTDSATVDQAVQRWTELVREKIENGTLVSESNMHEILYRLAEFNGAFAEVFEVVRKICSTDDGLEEFLSVYVKDSPFNDIQAFGLVDDAAALVSRINESSLSAKYAWLVTLIQQGDAIRLIHEHAQARRRLANRDVS